MATYCKRKNSWRVEVCKNGVRRSATFDTKSAAKEWAVAKEAELTQGAHKYTNQNKKLGDIFDRYKAEVSPAKKGYRWERIRLSSLGASTLAKVSLKKVDATLMSEWRDQRLTEVSAATVNRELNLISSTLTTAKREWGWLTHNPISEIKRPKNPKPRDRRISDHEIERVLLACQYEVGQVPESRTQLVGCLFLLALETAMRLGELCAIRSDDIFLKERYVVLRDTKNNDRRHVPLSKKAVQLFTVIKALDFHVAPLVASSLFRKVCKRAEIEGLRFHDTRHEALTQLARKIDVLDLARMVGHRDTRSLMIYYNATATEIANRLD